MVSEKICLQFGWKPFKLSMLRIMSASKYYQLSIFAHWRLSEWLSGLWSGKYIKDSVVAHFRIVTRLTTTHLLSVNQHDFSFPAASATCCATHLNVCPSDSWERFIITDRLSVTPVALTLPLHWAPWSPWSSPQHSVGVGYAPNQVQWNRTWVGSCAGAHIQSGCLSGASSQDKNIIYELDRNCRGRIGLGLFKELCIRSQSSWFDCAKGRTYISASGGGDFAVSTKNLP